MKKNILFLVPICFLTLLLASCGGNSPVKEENTNDAGTPVTLTTIGQEPLQEVVELNATSSFTLKSNVKSNTNGYLQNLKIKLGDYVNKGDELFLIKTKEAESLGNTINQVDSSLHFKGIIIIKAPGSGYVTGLDHQTGDYVQDGEQVLTISDAGSFVFLLDLPYELTPYLPKNNSFDLRLPDSTFLKGVIIKAMPSADAASQTQRYQIKVNTVKMIPENLIAKVKLIKRNKENAISIPTQAVLTNETQSEFWIMKMMNDTTAVKIPIQKGMENTSRIEVLSPVLTTSDRIILTGNYGLADTAKVQIVK